MRLYVCSKSRTWILPKTLPSWLATGLQVILVVDDSEAEEYERAVHGTGAWILPTNTRGIGSARQAALEHSMSGYDFHYQIDDDHIAPPNTTDLLDALNHRPGANFISAWKRQLNFYQAKLLDIPGDVVPTESNMTAGLRLIRNEPLYGLGGFDTELWLAEDCEVHMRTGMANGVRPLLHKGVLATPVGARFQPGGCQASGSFNAHALDATMRLNERYGEGTASFRPWGKEGKMRFSIHISKFWEKVDKAHASSLI